MQNSAHQLRNLLGAFTVVGPLPQGAALLVDDLVDSSWTMTLLAALLRSRGSGPVYPFALAKSSSAMKGALQRPSLVGEATLEDAERRSEAQVPLSPVPTAPAAALAQEEAEWGEVARTCSTCGRPIPLERLYALPDADRCVPCQEAHERAGVAPEVVTCRRCGAPMVWRVTRSPDDTRYFLGCSRFPECRYLEDR